jgi:sulfur-carrier protein
MVTVLYFAWVRDAVGIAQESIALPATVSTAGELAALLATRGPGHAQAFADMSKLRCAVDLAMVGFDARIGDAQEVAFFPPVTGG